MAIDRVISSDSGGDKEEQFNNVLRPKHLSEIVGQKNVIEKLSIAIAAAKKRGEPLEHILFYAHRDWVRPHWPMSLPMK